MAIYHCAVKVFSRNNGRSAVGAAAYRSATRIVNEYDGVIHDYTQKGGVVHNEIILCSNAPQEYNDRPTLWNAVERDYKDSKAQLAREYEVALPIELTREEQIQLTREFAIENFVSNGMCADICIHDKRDGNPHAHIMLTMRPIDEKGQWESKSEKVYLCKNQQGEERDFTAKELKRLPKGSWEKQLPYYKDGDVKQPSVYLTKYEAENDTRYKDYARVKGKYNPKKSKEDRVNPTIAQWNSERFLEKCREDWARKINLRLEQKGLIDRVDHRSYEEQGIDKTPTVHEGKTAGSKSRAEYNQRIKEQEKVKQQIAENKERLDIFARFDLLTKNLTEKERARIAELSGSLKTFINFQNIEDKKRMIYNWRTSTYVKQNFGVDAAKTFQTIGEQETAILEADTILLSMSKQLLDKVYPHINQGELTDYEIKWLADTTIRGGVLTKEEAEQELQELRPHLLEKQIVLITKQPFAGWLNLEKSQRITESKIKNLLKRHGRDINTYQETGKKSPADFYGEDFKKIGYLFKDLSRTAALKKVITEHYDEVLSRAFPEADCGRLPILEKETVYNLVMYYNPENRALTLDELLRLPEQGKFSSGEREAGLRFICSGDIEEISNNTELVRVLSNEGMKSLFIGECIEDKTISPDLLGAAAEKLAAEETEKKQYVERADRGLAYPVRKSVSIYNHFLSLLSVVDALFSGHDEEEIRKQKARNKRLAELEESMKKDGRKQQRGPHL